MNKIYDLIIIGAGSSSTYLALNLDDNIETLIIDRNDQILKKFLISGGGKANITNCCDFNVLLSNMIYGSKNFMYHAFKTNPYTNIINFLKENKLDYAQRENSTKIHLLCSNKVFINKVWEKLNNKKNIQFKLNTRVINVFKKNEIFNIETENAIFYSRKLVIATGGLSFSKFANTSGDGYKFAKSFNHNVSQTFPMGISIDLINQIPQFETLMGTSFKDVKCDLFIENKKIISETNDLMITTNGIGGPIIRRISGYITYNKAKNIYILLSLINKEKLVLILEKIKKIHELWKEFNFFTKKFIQNFYKNLNLNSNSDVKNFSKIAKQKVIDYFVDIKINNFNKNFKYEPAINTGGGINTKEINPINFMSKIIDNLYFIGEVLDVNAKTGGFNLTLCYASALCCAKDIKKEL